MLIWLRRLLVIGLPLNVMILASCGSRDDSRQTKWIRSEIFFGRIIPGGGQVSEEQFAAFLQDSVTKAFPVGMTVYDVYGQMERADGDIVRQDTKVVLLVHDGSQANEQAINDIISNYRSNFGNPQVMHLRTGTEPQFWGD
jgi:hypothetical protein